MSVVGHNQPPDMTVSADETMKNLSNWMSEHPVIEDEDTAREAKVYIDRAKLCVKDLEDERDKKAHLLKKMNNELERPRELNRKLLETLLVENSALISKLLWWRPTLPSESLKEPIDRLIWQNAIQKLKSAEAIQEPSRSVKKKR